MTPFVALLLASVPARAEAPGDGISWLRPADVSMGWRVAWSVEDHSGDPPLPPAYTPELAGWSRQVISEFEIPILWWPSLAIALAPKLGLVTDDDGFGDLLSDDRQLTTGGHVRVGTPRGPREVSALHPHNFAGTQISWAAELGADWVRGEYDPPVFGGAASVAIGRRRFTAAGTVAAYAASDPFGGLIPGVDLALGGAARLVGPLWFVIGGGTTAPNLAPRLLSTIWGTAGFALGTAETVVLDARYMQRYGPYRSDGYGLGNVSLSHRRGSSTSARPAIRDTPDLEGLPD